MNGDLKYKVIYVQKRIPLLQNVVYKTQKEAIKAECTDIVLVQDEKTGLVYNAAFEPNRIMYVGEYQNEQGLSDVFKKHLVKVSEILDNKQLLNGSIVEIGCGKGFFLEMLLNKGVDVRGFDPAYEGNIPVILKDLFSEKYNEINADTIILRHVLEHIPDPLTFLHTVAQANQYKGRVYIEVPSFDWIIKNNACEDIFYEHCNYFTPETLSHFFTASECGCLFGNQYFYLIADFENLKKNLDTRSFVPSQINMNETVERYSRFVATNRDIALWGSGAKGVTFANLTDKQRIGIKCLIDINPMKQNKFIGGTGHPVIDPGQIVANGIKKVIVMNILYLEEIRSVLTPLGITPLTLNDVI